MAARKKLESQVSLDMCDSDAQRLLNFLKCVDCQEMAREAVETLCCKVLLCDKCFEQRDRQCPQCNAACSLAPSHLARRLIGMQPWRCGQCGKETTRSEQTDHELICPQRVRTCPVADCSFTGLSEAFIDHLIEAHSEKLLENVENLFKQVQQPERRRRDWSESSEHSFLPDFITTHRWGRRRQMIFNSQESVDEDAISREHSRVRMEVTGKNYCSGALNGPPCNCCDGRCGPGNGCNCVNCMRLDLVTFRVSTPLTLVNREGVVARISRETGKFYCGRAVMAHDPRTNGFCGPNNGNNCHACHKLDEQLHNRYAAIADEWNLEDVPDVADMTESDEDEDLSSMHMAMGLDVID